jgi:phosphotransferase system  glucose/maltose/N-acetylglucosamine-specific IIC component
VSSSNPSHIKDKERLCDVIIGVLNQILYKRFHSIKLLKIFQYTSLSGRFVLFGITFVESKIVFFFFFFFIQKVHLKQKKKKKKKKKSICLVKKLKSLLS